jgi:hypothetical protein
MERSFGRIEEWVGFEDGGGWVKFFNGSMVNIDRGVWKLTSSTAGAAKSIDVAATAANDAAALFRSAAKMTVDAANEILSSASRNVAAKPGEENVTWLGRQDAFLAAVTKKYGAIAEGDIYEDGSGQIVLADGRKIELDGGNWRFVDRFKYAAPLGGRTRFSVGGRVYGPGTTTSDSIPAWLSKDEYVLKASAAKAIGYQNLDRLNGADTQPLKAGFQYAPAAAPARQSVAATESVRSSGVSVGAINITQVDDPIGTSHAVTRRMSALAI